MTRSSSSDSSSDSPLPSTCSLTSGSYSIGNGTIDGGSVSTTLAAQQAGDNQVSFAADSNEIAVAFARFISSSLLEGISFPRRLEKQAFRKELYRFILVHNKQKGPLAGSGGLFTR